jgi:hypothetical protein
VGSHLAVNALSLIEADNNMKRGEFRAFGKDLEDQTFRERSFIYVENIPKVVEDIFYRLGVLLGSYSELDSSRWEDAWWMLMIRMQCVSIVCICFSSNI